MAVTTVPVVVRASGTSAGNVAAHFKVLVDGKVIGQASAATTTRDYKFSAALDTNLAHKVEVVFDNDAVIGGQDRNLLLTSLTIGGRTIAATSPYEVYHAPGQGDFASNGNMSWNGSAEFSLPGKWIPAPASTPPAPTPTGTAMDLVVRASGTPAGGVSPHFKVLLDGATVGQASAGTAAANYTFKVTLDPAKAHTVGVVFDNDDVVAGQDRNLILSSITLGGRTAAATDAVEVFHAPGIGDFAGSGNMYWNGTAEFSLPASWTAQPTGPTTPPVTPPTAQGFHVSLTGSDSADGSAAHPFATLARALAAIDSTSTIKTVYLHGGTYQLNGTVTLDSTDTGAVLQAFAGETPVLDGGVAHLGSLLALKGASNVTIQGLSFANAGTDGAVVLQNADGNRIVANHFTNNGKAIVLAASSHNTISGNLIEQSAQSAIEAKDASNSNTFDSNWIKGVGGRETYDGGFFLHGASNNVISHNLVENTQGMGIGINNWDSTTVNLGNTVQYNVVRNTNLSAQDSGGIYMLGRSHADTKSVISHNLVENYGSDSRHNVGIYLDDSTSGVLVDGNIVRGTGRHGAQIHGGDNNTISNNIFDLGTGNTSAVLFQSAPLDTNPINTMLGNLVTKNIIYSGSTHPVAYDWIDGGAPAIRQNLYFNTTGAAMPTSAPTRDTAAVVGNPQFVDAAHGNYALGAGSAASSIGFQPIDQSALGLSPTASSWWLH